MKEFTPQQISYIYQDLYTKGITLPELADNLVDHICCLIEENPEDVFEDNYKNSLDRFGEDKLEEIQRKTILLIQFKNMITMKKTMYVIGFIAVFLSTTGLLFKLQHWPGAGVMLTLGIALLNFGFLPMYFIDRYRSSVKKLA